MLVGSLTEVSTPRGRRAGATASLYFASSSMTMLLPIEYFLPDPQTINIPDDRRHSLQSGLKFLSDTCIHE